MTNPTENLSFECLSAHLARLDVLLAALTAHTRRLLGEEPGGTGYISDGEVLAFLSNRALRLDEEERAALAGLVRKAEEKISPMRSGRKRPRLERLAKAFALGEAEILILLAALAPEIDPRYTRVYGYLQDNMSLIRPSVAIACELVALLEGDVVHKSLYRALLAPDAPLIRHRLIALVEDRPHLPFAARGMLVTPRLTAWLLEEDDVPDLEPARLIPAKGKADWPEIPEPDRNRLAEQLQLATRGRRAGTPRKSGVSAVFYVQGRYGAGREALVRALCLDKKIALLVVDGSRAVREHEHLNTLLPLVFRELRLLEAALYWSDFHLLTEEDRAGDLLLMQELLESEPGPFFLGGEGDWEPSDRLHDLPVIRYSLPELDVAGRLRAWEREREGQPPFSATADLQALAGAFRFTPGRIRDAAATARDICRRRAPRNGEVSNGDLQEACRLQSNQKLSILATKVVPRYSLSDIVLPREQQASLNELLAAARQGDLVLDGWGFSTKFSLGNGLTALFTGPPGTGKTMAAEVLGFELGLDLYRIDLAAVVSKYIGETEKNLDKIFTEAETANAVLFFDEADALFGKRGEVQAAHDRYANTEIAYLLQKMEAYRGIAILTTNLRRNLDDAFVRRLRFCIEFPMPDAEERRAIWHTVWPEHVPRAPDLDLDGLAERLGLAGGHIRNIVLSASFLAADEGGRVEMRHLIHATRREFGKMGRIAPEVELRALENPVPT